MKRTVRLTESDFTRIVRRAINEEEDYDIAQTVIDTEAFTNEDIPEECN